MEVPMYTIPMSDPWIENIFTIEFKSDHNKFLEKIKKLLTEDKKREQQIAKLFKEYENAEISVGKMAEQLHMSKDDVLDLMEKHNVYLVDYDFSEDEKTIEKYLTK